MEAAKKLFGAGDDVSPWRLLGGAVVVDCLLLANCLGVPDRLCGGVVRRVSAWVVAK